MSDDDTIGSMEPVARDSRRNTADEVRANRVIEDHAIRGSREDDLSDEDRLEIFRNSFMQAALPTLPKIPGWHVCWVSLTNERDTVPLRRSLGYQPITPEDVVGWRGGNITTLNSGELSGWVNHNEMVAMKIRQELYERFMQEVHHNAPAAEDQKLIYQAERHAEESRRLGGELITGDGLDEIKSTASVRRGKFS